MIISENEKNRIRKLHKEHFILNEQGLGSMASVGSGFVNQQGGTGRVEKFIDRQTELGNGYYDFSEYELNEQKPSDSAGDAPTEQSKEKPEDSVGDAPTEQTKEVG